MRGISTPLWAPPPARTHAPPPYQFPAPPRAQDTSHVSTQTLHMQTPLFPQVPRDLPCSPGCQSHPPCCHPDLGEGASPGELKTGGEAGLKPTDSAMSVL